MKFVLWAVQVPGLVAASELGNVYSRKNEVELNHNNISQAIILSSALFGLCYMHSISLKELNKMLLKSKNENGQTINYPFIVLNGSIFVTSTTMIMVFYSKGYSIFFSQS